MNRSRQLRGILIRRRVLPTGLSGMVALGLSAVLLISGIGAFAPAPDYGIVPSWSKTTITISTEVQITLKYISEVHIYGAADDLPTVLSMEIDSLAKNLWTFVVVGMSVKGITPKGGSGELLGVEIDPGGLVVCPGASAVWDFTVVPCFPKKPPLQVLLEVGCSLQGTAFSLKTNVVFRIPAPASASPITLTHVYSQDHLPWLGDTSWGGVTYYYSVEATYPVGAGVSLYPAHLVLIFTSEYPIVHDSISIFRDGAVISLEVSGCTASGIVPMNGGALLYPGYYEVYHLAVLFSMEMQDQDIEWAISAESA